MEEWKEYKLGEICTKIGSGATPKGGKEAYLGGDTSLIRSQNVLDFSFSWDGLAYIDDEQAAKLNGVIIERGDVLLNITGDSVARACIVPESALPARVNQHVSIIRGNTAIVLNDYILYFLQYKKPYLLSLSKGGATRNALTKGMIEDLLIPLPPIFKQAEIVRVLKSLDDKIEVNRRINDNLEKQAQALFKSWFVDFNPFKDGEFVESELGMIPKGWRAGTLSEIANITMGTSPSGASYNVNGEGVVFYQGRAEFGYRFPHRNMYTTEPKRYAEDGDVLLSVRAPVGDVNIANERCCIGRGLAAIGSESCPSYILYLVKSLKSVFEQYNGEGTVFGSINKKTLEGLRIIVPESKYIERFEKVANPLDGQIRCKEEESRRLASLRDTLLPKLMSGELKLNEVNV